MFINIIHRIPDFCFVKLRADEIVILVELLRTLLTLLLTDVLIHGLIF